MTPRVRRLALASMVAFATTGCVGSRPAKTPMDTLAFAAHCDRPVDTLVVLLPGAYDRADAFVDQGFVDALRRRHVAADVVLADASMAYFRQRTLVDRLEADVLAPARARGIRHVWFAGISLGGLGGVIVATERPGEVDGLLLIAPYLGERAATAEVAAAGGLARWTAPTSIAPDDIDHRVWSSLQRLTASGPAAPSIWLGYGVDDRFAASHGLLAARLPPDHVFVEPGDHDWPAWRAAWAAMLDRAPLPHDARCVVPPFPADR